MKEIKIIDIQNKDMRRAAEVIKASFVKDPFITNIFDSDELFEKNSIELFQTWVKYGILYGKAWATENFETVAVRKVPTDVKPSLWKLFRSGMFKSKKLLGDANFERFKYIYENQAKLRKEILGDKPFLYCMVIGTDPKYQRQGFGAAMMSHTFNYADTLHVPCYLDTITDLDVEIHSKYGYEVKGSFVLPDGKYKNYGMLRQAR